MRRLAVRCYARGAAQSSPGGAGKGDVKEKDKHLALLLAALQPAAARPAPPSAAQLAADQALAKDYSRRMMSRLRAGQKDLGLKMRLRLEATAALPPELRIAAELPDLTLFPARRRLPSETMPKPGYAEGLRQGAEDAVRASGSSLLGGKRR